LKRQIQHIGSAWVMSKINNGNSIAIREVLFCLKGGKNLSKLIVRIRGPYLVDKESVNFRFDEGTAGCKLEFEGLSELNTEVFGVDELHALSLAVDIDPYLKSMTSKYDFYWADGEPYFDA